MGLIALKCPNCGANIDIDDNRDSCFCSYCGSKIVNENVKTMRMDNSAQFTGALMGAFNALVAKDRGVAEPLIDKALEYDGGCSDALYVKSAILAETDYAKAARYHGLAKSSTSSVGKVTAERYRELLVARYDALLEDSNRYVRNTLSRTDLTKEDIQNCMVYVSKNTYDVIACEFPYFSEVIREESERRFAEIEGILNVPNGITQENWDALRRFDREGLLTSTSLMFSNVALKERYGALIRSYCDRLNGKWVVILKKGPVDVDRKEYSLMRERVNMINRWASSFCAKKTGFLQQFFNK